MENCYQEIGTGKINKIAQPDKIVGIGKFNPSKLDNAVDKVMEGKETISVPKFKETVWQKIKNALHIGKGQKARTTTTSSPPKQTHKNQVGRNNSGGRGT